ncbi:MAG TPA: hypothetical protein PLA90_14300, partial [Candidatus Sumerlaeota bacterium]|nr:hypothetical protein [Candidatus Sumerlaeota bacterium]
MNGSGLFPAFQEGATIVAMRLIEGLSRKMWTDSTGFRVGGVKTDLFLFNHEKHERPGAAKPQPNDR